jgi:hypothetical protein
LVTVALVSFEYGARAGPAEARSQLLFLPAAIRFELIIRRRNVLLSPTAASELLLEAATISGRSS